jgi:DNA-binding MarR family transcriptional regulator
MQSDVRTLYLIRDVQLHCRSRMSDALQPFDISTSQYTILSILDRRDGLSAAQLSRRFRVTPQSINTLIGGLEDRGLISRSEAPDNRRILKTTLTRSGRQLLAACDAAIDAAEAELFAALSNAELSGFRQALLKVATYLHGDVSVPA